jgi:hypothetical protein
MSASMTLTHALSLLQRARVRVASGWPGVEMALAAAPGATVTVRLEVARNATPEAPQWVLALAESLRRMDVARVYWGQEPAKMPPAVANLALCGLELRTWVADAQACEKKQPAWEDSGGLTRAQAVCVLHLAVVLAQWDMAVQRSELTAQ